MTALLFMTAALLLASALVKLRSAARIGIGLHLFSILEFLMCLAVAAVAMGGVATPGAGFAFVGGAVVLSVASSVHLGVRMAAERRRREDSQARRLETYVILN